MARSVFAERGLPQVGGRFPGVPYPEVLPDEALFVVVWERPELGVRPKDLNAGPLTRNAGSVAGSAAAEPPFTISRSRAE